MFRRMFWMMVGAGLGLWGRQRAIQTSERYVPAPARRFIVRNVKSFVADVAKAQAAAKAEAKRAAKSHHLH